MAEGREVLLSASIPVKQYTAAEVLRVKVEGRTHLEELGCKHIEQKEVAVQAVDGSLMAMVVQTRGLRDG